MCQGFSHFPGFLHECVLPKLATSSIRFKENISVISTVKLLWTKELIMNVMHIRNKIDTSNKVIFIRTNVCVFYAASVDEGAENEHSTCL